MLILIFLWIIIVFHITINNDTSFSFITGTKDFRLASLGWQLWWAATFTSTVTFIWEGFHPMKESTNTWIVSFTSSVTTASIPTSSCRGCSSSLLSARFGSWIWFQPQVLKVKSLGSPPPYFLHYLSNCSHHYCPILPKIYQDHNSANSSQIWAYSWAMEPLRIWLSFKKMSQTQFTY